MNNYNYIISATRHQNFKLNKLISQTILEFLFSSVSTTSLPIEGLAWPSITVCNQGRGLGAVERVYKVQLERYIKEKGISIKDLNDEQINEEENMFLEER